MVNHHFGALVVFTLAGYASAAVLWAHTHALFVEDRHVAVLDVALDDAMTLDGISPSAVWNSGKNESLVRALRSLFSISCGDGADQLHLDSFSGYDLKTLTHAPHIVPFFHSPSKTSLTLRRLMEDQETTIDNHLLFSWDLTPAWMAKQHWQCILYLHDTDAVRSQSGEQIFAEQPFTLSLNQHINYHQSQHSSNKYLDQEAATVAQVFTALEEAEEVDMEIIFDIATDPLANVITPMLVSLGVQMVLPIIIPLISDAMADVFTQSIRDSVMGAVQVPPDSLRRAKEQLNAFQQAGSTMPIDNSFRNEVAARQANPFRLDEEAEQNLAQEVEKPYPEEIPPLHVNATIARNDPIEDDILVMSASDIAASFGRKLVLTRSDIQAMIAEMLPNIPQKHLKHKLHQHAEEIMLMLDMDGSGTVSKEEFSMFGLHMIELAASNIAVESKHSNKRFYGASISSAIASFYAMNTHAADVIDQEALQSGLHAMWSDAAQQSSTGFQNSSIFHCIQEHVENGDAVSIAFRLFHQSTSISFDSYVHNYDHLWNMVEKLRHRCHQNQVKVPKAELKALFSSNITMMDWNDLPVRHHHRSDVDLAFLHALPHGTRKKDQVTAAAFVTDMWQLMNARGDDAVWEIDLVDQVTSLLLQEPYVEARYIQHRDAVQRRIRFDCGTLFRYYDVNQYPGIQKDEFQKDPLGVIKTEKSIYSWLMNLGSTSSAMALTVRAMHDGPGGNMWSNTPCLHLDAVHERHVASNGSILYQLYTIDQDAVLDKRTVAVVMKDIATYWYIMLDWMPSSAFRALQTSLDAIWDTEAAMVIQLLDRQGSGTISQSDFDQFPFLVLNTTLSRLAAHGMWYVLDLDTSNDVSGPEFVHGLFKCLAPATEAITVGPDAIWEHAIPLYNSYEKLQKTDTLEHKTYFRHPEHVVRHIIPRILSRLQEKRYQHGSSSVHLKTSFKRILDPMLARGIMNHSTVHKLKSTLSDLSSVADCRKHKSQQRVAKEAKAVCRQLHLKCTHGRVLQDWQILNDVRLALWEDESKQHETTVSFVINFAAAFFFDAERDEIVSKGNIEAVYVSLLSTKVNQKHSLELPLEVFVQADLEAKRLTHRLQRATGSNIITTRYFIREFSTLAARMKQSVDQSSFSGRRGTLQRRFQWDFDMPGMHDTTRLGSIPEPTNVTTSTEARKAYIDQLWSYYDVQGSGTLTHGTIQTIMEKMLRTWKHSSLYERRDHVYNASVAELPQTAAAIVEQSETGYGPGIQHAEFKKKPFHVLNATRFLIYKWEMWDRLDGDHDGNVWQPDITAMLHDLAYHSSMRSKALYMLPCLESNITPLSKTLFDYMESNLKMGIQQREFFDNVFVIRRSFLALVHDCALVQQYSNSSMAWRTLDPLSTGRFDRDHLSLYLHMLLRDAERRSSYPYYEPVALCIRKRLDNTTDSILAALQEGNSSSIPATKRSLAFILATAKDLTHRCSNHTTKASTTVSLIEAAASTRISNLVPSNEHDIDFGPLCGPLSSSVSNKGTPRILDLLMKHTDRDTSSDSLRHLTRDQLEKDLTFATTQQVTSQLTDALVSNLTDSITKSTLIAAAATKPLTHALTSSVVPTVHRALTTSTVDLLYCQDCKHGRSCLQCHAALSYQQAGEHFALETASHYALHYANEVAYLTAEN